MCAPVLAGGALNSVLAAAPSIAAKAAGPQAVSVSWAKVSGAKKYAVYRSTGGANPFKQLGTTTGASYTDKTAYPNICYTYRVAAQNGSKTVATSQAKTAATPKKTYRDTDTAVFKNKFLENWARGRLGKKPTDRITVKDLDKITAIKFAGSTELTGGTTAEASFVGASGFGVSVNGKNTIAWDFYSLDDLMQFRKLTSLTIMGQQVTDISPLANLPLTSLNLGANHVSDINPLGRVTSLQNLTLAANPVSDLSALGGLNRLSDLDLSGTSVSGVAAIARLPRLNSLKLDYSSVKDLSALAGTKSITFLGLTGVAQPDLSFLPKTKSLTDIGISRLNQTEARWLQQSTVTGMDIVYDPDSSLPALNMPKLNRLELYNCSAENLSFASGCGGLTFLGLHNTEVSDISAVSRFMNLTEFDVNNALLYDVSALKTLPKLKTLTLPASAEKSYAAGASSIRAKPNFVEGGFTYYPFRGAYHPSASTDPKPASVALQAPDYVSIGAVGAYDKAIITDALLGAPSTLPEASGSSIPYWTGTISEAKASALSGWMPVPYWTEQDVEFLADNKMDYLRALYSFTFLSDPNDPGKVNLNAVKEIDQLIAWGVKYNVHIELSMIGLPNKWGETPDDENIGSLAGGTNYFGSASEQAAVRDYWSMLAKRYAAIPNKYLDFELYAEPHWDDATYAPVVIDLANAVWQAEGNKSRAERRILFAEDVYPFLDDLLAPLQEHKIAWALNSFGDIIKPSRNDITVKNYPGTPWWYDSGLVARYQKYCN